MTLLQHFRSLITVVSTAWANKVDIRRVDTLADLRGIPVDYIADGDQCTINCSTTPGDGGAGNFRWDATSVAADDGFATILPTGYAGTGRWKRIYVGDKRTDTGAVAFMLHEYHENRPINVKTDFGAVGDGTTDDTSALQAALNTGKPVFIPPVSTYYKITSTLTGNDYQRIFGAGAKSQIRQITANLNVFSATSKTGLIIEDLKLYAVGSRTSYADGHGVFLSSCSKSIVRNCTVENHRGAGVCLYNTNDSVVADNVFINSPVADLALDTTAFADVAVVYSSNRNKVYGNTCTSGQGTGVLVQSVADGNNCDDNIVFGNVIQDCKVYGIAAYRNDDAAPLTQTCRRTTIFGNTIENISGTIENSTTSTYTYGAGIYIQGAEEAVVNGNTINGTHTGAVTFAETLAPGAIGTTNVTRVAVTGNVIEDANMFGIDVGDANTLGETLGYAVVSGNTVTNATKSGINVRNRGRVSINGNTVDTTGLSGIRVNNTVSQRPDISVIGNHVRNTTGTANIEANYAEGLVISGNTCDTSNTHGIIAANCGTVSISGNVVRDTATRGIQVLSTVTDAFVDSNIISGTGTTTEGIRLDALTRVGQNKISGCTTAWAGNFAVLRGTQNTTAVGNVGVGEDDLMSYVLPAGALEANGDGIHVSAWGVTANNANAKTLKMYFGTALILTNSLTVSQSGVWRVEASIIKTSANAQRCVVQLNEGGATTQVDVESTSATETESASITVKLTGEATANNDVQQLGMAVSFFNG